MKKTIESNPQTESKAIKQETTNDSMHSPKNKDLISAYKPLKKSRGKQFKLKSFNMTTQNKKLLILRKKVDVRRNARPVVSFKKVDFCRKSKKQIFGKVKKNKIFKKVNCLETGKGPITKENIKLRNPKFNARLYQRTLEKDFTLIFKENLDLQNRVDFLESQNKRMKVQDKSKDQQILGLKWKVEQLQKEVCFLKQKMFIEDRKTNKVFVKQKGNCKVPNNFMKTTMPFYLKKINILKKRRLGKISKADASANLPKTREQLKKTRNFKKLPNLYVNKIRKLNKHQTKNKKNNNLGLHNRNTRNKPVSKKKRDQYLLNKGDTTNTINIYEINSKNRKNSFEQFARKKICSKDLFNLSGTDDFNEFDFEYKAPMAIIKKVFRVPSQKNKLRLKNKLAMIHKTNRLNPKTKPMDSLKKIYRVLPINNQETYKTSESKEKTGVDPNLHFKKTLDSWSNTKQKESTLSKYTKTTKISSVNHKRNKPKLATCNLLLESKKNKGLFNYSGIQQKQLNSDYFNESNESNSSNSSNTTSQLDIWNSKKKLDTGNPIKIINGMNLFLEEHRSIDRSRRQTMGYLTNTLRLKNQNLLRKSRDLIEEVQKNTRPVDTETLNNQNESGASRSDKTMYSNESGRKESNRIVRKSVEMGLSEEIFSVFETLVNTPVYRMRKTPRKAIKRKVQYSKEAIQAKV